MKLLTVLVSMFIGSAAFAAQDKCLLTVVDANGTTSTLVDMEIRQNPRADIPGYILNVTHEGFQVFASEADGNFYGKVTTASGDVSEGEAHDQNLVLSATEGDQTLTVECY